MKKKILISFLATLLFTTGCGSTTSSSTEPSTSTCHHIDVNPHDFVCDICGEELPKPVDPVTEGIKIDNKDTLKGLWTCSSGERVIQISDPEHTNVLAALEDGFITITSSDTSVIDVIGLYLKPMAVGFSKITVSNGSTTDSVELEIVEPSDKSPKFFLDYDGVSKFSTYVGQGVALPKFSCFDANNRDISDLVTVSSDLDENCTFDSMTGVFTTNVEGTHNVTYLVEVGSYRTTKTVSVRVCKSLMDYSRGGSNQKVQVANGLTDDPYIYISCSQSQSGMEALAFNVTPSQVYYAEALFKKPELSGISVGFAHSKESTNKGFIREHVNVPNKDKGECNVTKAYNYGNSQHVITVYPAKLRTLIGEGGVNPGVYVSQDWTKIAIARVHNDYYFFIDGYCYDHYTSKDFDGINTLPAIYCGGWKVGLNGTQAKKVVLLDGAQAIEKVDSLKGSLHEYGYARNDNSLSYSCGSYDKVNKELLFETKNLNQQYYNSIIMNNNLFQGSTHIAFRYEAMQVSPDDYSVFMVSAMNQNFGSDPNSKLCQLFKGSIRHAGSYNTTFYFNTQQHETIYDAGDMRFQGNNTDFHWDVGIWDIDINVVVDETSVNVDYTMSEYAKKTNEGTTIIPEGERKIYHVNETSGFVMPNADIAQQPWLALCFEQHNPQANSYKSSYKISNLVIESI